MQGLLVKFTAGNATAMAKKTPDHNNVEIGSRCEHRMLRYTSIRLKGCGEQAA